VENLVNRIKNHFLMGRRGVIVEDPQYNVHVSFAGNVYAASMRWLAFFYSTILTYIVTQGLHAKDVL
jgi:hypothetical protein